VFVGRQSESGGVVAIADWAIGCRWSKNWARQMTMIERFNTPLINPTWDEELDREPLLTFSFYLSSRVIQLLSIAVEITEDLDRGFGANPIDIGRVARASTLMWLWTLGAYEVVRTMCQAKMCFSPEAIVQLQELKRQLASVRIPDAKMEKPGRREPVTSNRSPDGWDFEKGDIVLGDPEAQPPISARFLLSEFNRVMSSMKKTDVLKHHRASYREA
jgi:hypothetical protein